MQTQNSEVLLSNVHEIFKLCMLPYYIIKSSFDIKLLSEHDLFNFDYFSVGPFHSPQSVTARNLCHETADTVPVGSLLLVYGQDHQYSP